MTEKIKSELQYIHVKDIYPHPDNPRKDVGDITELIESIKNSGIMQNLTVVPYEMNGENCYRVIIGHRRLAAAKAAGLETAPCIISDMDYKDQIATMISENMQRVDLTVYEQVQGIQMMFELGESVEDVVKKTGLSKQTVKKRAKIAALPADELKAAEQRGGTLEEYVECMKLEDEKKRNELLKYAGTNDFCWKSRMFIKEQTAKKSKPIILAEVKKFAKKFESPNDMYSGRYSYVQSVRFDSWKEGDSVFENRDDAEKYFYWATDYDVSIYKKEKKQKSKPVKKSEAEIKAALATKKLADLTKTAFELRSEFLEKLPITKERETIITKYIAFFAAKGQVRWESTRKSWIDDSLKTFRNPNSESYYPTDNEIRAWLKSDTKAYVRIAQCLAEEDDDNGFYQAGYAENMPKYFKNDRLAALYEMIEALGYQTSEDEKKLMDGTHEVFKK